MRIRTLAGALAMTGLVAASLPAQAEAAHRHSRSCGHGGYSYGSSRYSPRYGYGGSYGYRGYGYRGPSYSRYYAPRHYAPRYSYRPYAYTRYAYDPYGYGVYQPYGYYGPYAAPYPVPGPIPGHYHGRAWCVRPHLSIHVGF